MDDQVRLEDMGLRGHFAEDGYGYIDD